MERNKNTIEHRLLKAFLQFEKADWHQKTFEGYKPSEIKLLFIIKRLSSEQNFEVKASEISDRLHVTRPTVTQLIKGLEAKGLIERNINPQDRRSVGIKLTKQGEQIRQRAFQIFTDTFQGLTEFLGEEQSHVLADLLDQVFIYFTERHSHKRVSFKNGDE